MVFMWFKLAEWPINPAFSRNLKPPPFRRWSIHRHPIVKNRLKRPKALTSFAGAAFLIDAR